MDKQELVRAFLTGDESQINQAKMDFKTVLTTKADEFKSGASQFLTQSIFDPKGK